MGNSVTSLISAGADAFTNLFDVSFTVPNAVMAELGVTQLDVSNNMTVRIQDFPFPSIKPDVYTINYKATTLKRIKPKFVSGARKLTLSFRVDAYWKLYTGLKLWKRLFQNEYDSDINFNQLTESDKLGQIVVRAYKSNTSLSNIVGMSADVDVGPKWEFNQVICKNVTEPDFKRESADPLIVQAEFIFGEYLTPEDDRPIP